MGLGGITVLLLIAGLIVYIFFSERALARKSTGSDSPFAQFTQSFCKPSSSAERHDRAFNASLAEESIPQQLQEAGLFTDWRLFLCLDCVLLGQGFYLRRIKNPLCF
jgi:hypothetical protein